MHGSQSEREENVHDHEDPQVGRRDLAWDSGERHREHCSRQRRVQWAVFPAVAARRRTAHESRGAGRRSARRLLRDVAGEPRCESGTHCDRNRGVVARHARRGRGTFHIDADRADGRRRRSGPRGGRVRAARCSGEGDLPRLTRARRHRDHVRRTARSSGMTDGATLARAGVSESTTDPWTLADDVLAYSAAGWRSIGVWLQKLERPVLDRFWFPETELDAHAVGSAADAIAASGLTVSHVVVAGRFTDRDTELRHLRIEYAVHAVEVAQRLRAGCLVVVPGRRGELSEREALDLSAASLSDVLERTE